MESKPEITAPILEAFLFVRPPATASDSAVKHDQGF